MILKRLLSNCIDFLIFVTLFFLIFKISSLETKVAHLTFFFTTAFLTVFILPVIYLGNTIGKTILNIYWLNSQFIKSKLILKYTLYFTSVLPSFSFISCIFSFPYFKIKDSNSLLVINVSTFFAFILTDIVFFVFSLGKFHILDYLLNLKIKGLIFKKNKWVSLGYIFCFFGLLFLAMVLSFRYNVSTTSLNQSINESSYKEYFPNDKFYGNNVLVMRNNSNSVFTISRPISFIFEQKLGQKTLYLELPEIAFNSEHERYRICVDLIKYSLVNDIFFEYEPAQTRIVLDRFRQGVFLETYDYRYIYYYDNVNSIWGIHGGIKPDSLTFNKYISFVNRCHQDEIPRIERKTDLKWSEIVKKANSDSAFRSRIEDMFGTTVLSTLTSSNLLLAVDSAQLLLSKINFSDAPLRGYVRWNFPPTEYARQVKFKNFLTEKILEIDEYVEELYIIRNVTSNEHL